MKVILNSNIDTLGMVGDIVDVKPGYARNFLFPRNLALEISKNNLEMTRARRKKIEKELEIERQSAGDIKEKLEELTLVITKKAGENDVLFGSVTAMDIQALLAEKGFDIDRKKLHLEEQIKRLGNFSCRVRLMPDIEATVRITVEPEEGPGESAAEDSQPQEAEAKSTGDASPSSGDTDSPQPEDSSDTDAESDT